MPRAPGRPEVPAWASPSLVTLWTPMVGAFGLRALSAKGHAFTSASPLLLKSLFSAFIRLSQNRNLQRLKLLVEREMDREYVVTSSPAALCGRSPWPHLLPQHSTF